MPDAITPEMRELQQQVYQGADEAGFQLPGRSDWGDMQTTLAGSKDTDGADIGMSGEMTVAVGADGQLVNQARNRAPGDAPSTHVLKIHVTPFVEFGADGNVPHVRWIANATVFELTKARIVISESSADDAAITAAQNGRPYEEYMNDAEYRNNSLGFHHDNPRDAVQTVLESISTDGRIDLPPKPTVTPESTATPAANPSRTKLALAGGGVIIAILGGWFVFNSGGDTTDVTVDDASQVAVGAEPESEPTVAADPTEVPVPTEIPTAEPTPEPTPTATPVRTAFTILDQTCIDLTTGAIADGCIVPTRISRSGDETVSVHVELPGDGSLPPGASVFLSLYLTDGPANDVLSECDSNGVCQAWLAPSFFNITTEWHQSEFFSTHSEVGFVFDLVATDDSSGRVAVPALEATDGTQIPGGNHLISEGIIFVEKDGVQGMTLFSESATFWW